MLNLHRGDKVKEINSHVEGVVIVPTPTEDILMVRVDVRLECTVLIPLKNLILLIDFD